MHISYLAPSCPVLRGLIALWDAQKKGGGVEMSGLRLHLLASALDGNNVHVDWLGLKSGHTMILDSDLMH
jgi:hypothetical protein